MRVLEKGDVPENRCESEFAAGAAALAALGAGGGLAAGSALATAVTVSVVVHTGAEGEKKGDGGEGDDEFLHKGLIFKVATIVINPFRLSKTRIELRR